MSNLSIRLDTEIPHCRMRALFKGAKLEVESVIREVCERVLYDTSINKETQRLRAQALGTSSFYQICS